MPDRPSFSGLAGAVIAAAVTCLYLVLAAREGNNDLAIVATFAVLIGGSAAAAAVGSLIADGPLRVALLATAATILLVVGVLGIFTIGMPLLLAGALTTGAAIRAGGRAR